MLDNKGFTLVEILVATGIVVTVLVGITSGVSFAVKNSRFSQEKALSVRYAQEGIEWIRLQRDVLGWNTFFNIINDEGPLTFTYCLNTLPQEKTDFSNLTPLESEECEKIPESIYTRYIDITVVIEPTGSNHVDFQSRVTWQADTETHETILSNTLYEWR